MKILTIYFSDIDPIVIEDEDDKTLEEYIRELSKILENNSVIILHTSSSSIIIRPNAISAVIVSDKNETLKTPKIKKHKPYSKNEKKIKKESDKTQDIISD